MAKTVPIERTYRLGALRRSLRRVYGRHTDAVISLLGNRMHPAVLSAALRGDLLEAHALQKVRSSFVDSVLSKHASATEKLGWAGFVNRPKWMSRPFRSRSSKKPELTFMVRPQWNTSEELFAHGGDTSILPFFSATFLSNPRLAKMGIGVPNALYVWNLQRGTGGRRGSELLEMHEELGRAPDAKEVRQADGASHLTMDELEALAMRRKLRMICVSIGNTPAEANLSDRPIHVELLHDYGRLLQQHGYRLIEIPHLWPGLKWQLIWVKSLPVPGAPKRANLTGALKGLRMKLRRQLNRFSRTQR